jgi:toxin ParE1/3/4
MKTYAVKFMPQAIDDIRSILDYIARDNPQRALSFVDEIEVKANSFLSTAPKGGIIYKNKTRYFPIGNYILLYEIDETKDQVSVLHVVNARTDWKKA